MMTLLFGFFVDILVLFILEGFITLWRILSMIYLLYGLQSVGTPDKLLKVFINCCNGYESSVENPLKAIFGSDETS